MIIGDRRGHATGKRHVDFYFGNCLRRPRETCAAFVFPRGHEITVLTEQDKPALLARTGSGGAEGTFQVPPQAGPPQRLMSSEDETSKDPDAGGEANRKLERSAPSHALTEHEDPRRSKREARKRSCVLSSKSHFSLTKENAQIGMAWARC